MSKYSGLTPKEVSALIAKHIKIAGAAIAEAEEIADETGVSFRLNLGGYGMGGYYNPKPVKPDDTDDDWEASDDDWEASDDDYGWQASSQSC